MDDNGIYSIKTTNIKVGQFPELFFSGNLGVRLSAIPSNRGFSTWHQSPGPMSWPNKKRHLAEVEVHMAYGGHGRPNTKSYEILETPAFTVISNIFGHRSPCCILLRRCRHRAPNCAMLLQVRVHFPIFFWGFDGGVLLGRVPHKLA